MTLQEMMLEPRRAPELMLQKELPKVWICAMKEGESWLLGALGRLEMLEEHWQVSCAKELLWLSRYDAGLKNGHRVLYCRIFFFKTVPAGTV